MSFFQSALNLASKEFHVFPLITNGKEPAIKDWQAQAATTAPKIKTFWVDPILDIIQPFNIGISTSNFKRDLALLVVDVDDKNGKCGSDTLLQLELKGQYFPDTLTQLTPTGGRHLIYKVKTGVVKRHSTPIKNNNTNEMIFNLVVVNSTFPFINGGVEVAAEGVLSETEGSTYIYEHAIGSTSFGLGSKMDLTIGGGPDSGFISFQINDVVTGILVAYDINIGNEDNKGGHISVEVPFAVINTN